MPVGGWMSWVTTLEQRLEDVGEGGGCPYDPSNILCLFSLNPFYLLTMLPQPAITSIGKD